MQIQVTECAPPDWDAFITSHPHASAYHRGKAVQIGAQAFGLSTHFITARDASGALCGALPLVEQSSLLFGRFLVSLPFFTYGGALASNDDSLRALIQHAIDLARKRRVDHVELRHMQPCPSISLPTRLDKVSMILPLPGSVEALGKQLGSKLRSQIKRAERESPRIVWGGAERIESFYRIFAPTMHALGTPVYPAAFFHTAVEAFGGLCEVLTLEVAGRTHAAAITVRHADRIEVPWAAASEFAKRSGINMRMYWELLCRALQSGAQAFDFGRSSLDSGTYRFKAQWGAQPTQLHWHYWLPRAGKAPVLNASNPKYALASRLWRRLPLPLANTLGPWLVRNLP